MRRAAVSVTSNIAEGAKRASNQDYARLLNIAEGSLAETESLLRLATDLDFGPTRNAADPHPGGRRNFAHGDHALRTVRRSGCRVHRNRKRPNI